MYGAEQYSIVKRFAQELDRTLAHGNNPHLGIAMRSDEDDWYLASLRFEFRLQFKTGHTRHANVEDQAGDFVPRFGIQELLRGPKAEHRQVVRLDQILQRALN